MFNLFMTPAGPSEIEPSGRTPMDLDQGMLLRDSMGPSGQSNYLAAASVDDTTYLFDDMELDDDLLDDDGMEDMFSSDLFGFSSLRGSDMASSVGGGSATNGPSVGHCLTGVSVSVFLVSNLSVA